MTKQGTENKAIRNMTNKFGVKLVRVCQILNFLLNLFYKKRKKFAIILLFWWEMRKTSEIVQQLELLVKKNVLQINETNTKYKKWTKEGLLRLKKNYKFRKETLI